MATVDDSILHLDESSARQLVLLRAIEDVDTQGKLLSEVERDQLEREALEASRLGSAGEISSVATTQPFWSPADKIAAPFLAPYLARRIEGALR